MNSCLYHLDISKDEKNWLERVSQINSPEAACFILLPEHSSKVSQGWVFEAEFL